VTVRVLCVSAPLSGHLDWGGYLATARELQARGDTLIWASGEAVRPQIEDAGLAFHPLAETGWRWPPPPPLQAETAGDPQTRQRLRQLRALDQWLEVERVVAATHELQALTREFRPDLIVTEMFIAAAAIVAELEQLPLVVAGWPAPAENPQLPPGADPLLATARERLDDLAARFQITGRNWTAHGPPALRSPHLHVSYWSPSWFAGAPLGEQTLHVGGRAPAPKAPDPRLPEPDGKPWVFITLGTTFNRDPNFFVAAARAATALDALPIIALSHDPAKEFGQALIERLPGECCVLQSVDFAAVLPCCAAAVHHGGAGTTHALVTHGIPQIVVPHAGDQARQAQGIARAGSGYYVGPRQASVQNLTNGLTNLLADGSPLRARAQALQAEFVRLGGAPRAAEAIGEAGLKIGD
jgi:MGT family glycosyltransferase